MQGKSKTKATTPEAELAQKETEYIKASSNERFVEKKVQASTEAVERFRTELNAEEERLARLVPVWVQAKKDAQQCLQDLRAVRSAVHGTGAAASGDGQRPTPMEQDADTFKQKLEQLNLSAKRARTSSNADHAALFACVDGLVAEAILLFKSGTTTTNFDSGSCPDGNQEFGEEGDQRCCSQH